MAFANVILNIGQFLCQKKFWHGSILVSTLFQLKVVKAFQHLAMP